MKRPTPRAWRGVMLLEILLGLALFVITAMVVLGGLSASTRTVANLHLEGQASDLAATVIAEILMGERTAMEPGPDAFEAPFEEWTWSISTMRSFTEAVGAPELTHLTVTVRHQPTGTFQSLTALLALPEELVPDGLDPEGFDEGAADPMPGDFDFDFEEGEL
ncbi:MAG: hypothetical protein JJU36_01035 [Phycisphaeraceae bacterium]|nr:hypothetical protein [Phycisphaeraceae bacterium]